MDFERLGRSAELPLADRKGRPDLTKLDISPRHHTLATSIGHKNVQEYLNMIYKHVMCLVDKIPKPTVLISPWLSTIVSTIDSGGKYFYM